MATITVTQSTDDRAPTAAGQHRTAFLDGAKAMAPWLIGLVPYGLVIGVAAGRAGIPAVAGWLTGPLIFSGGAQLAVIDLVHAGAATFVVLITVAAINLRLVLYSAAIAPHWRGTPWWWQAMGAYLLVDPTLAVGQRGYERGVDRRLGHLHYLGGAVLLWVAWLVSIGVAVTAGAHLPAAAHLELVIPLFLAGELTRRTKDRVSAAAVAAAAAVAVTTTAAPLRLGPVIAIAAGIATALVADRRTG